MIFDSWLRFVPIAVLLSQVALADSVALAGGRKSATIWSNSSTDKTKRKAIGTLTPGKRLRLRAEHPGWYEVSLPAEAVGFVQKKFTQLVAEPAALVTTFIAKSVSSAAEVPAGPPAAGQFRIHLIDVGTGLSMLVQGSDFSFLYDGGSKDDKARISGGHSRNRLIAYLRHALGASGPKDCSESGLEAAEEVSLRSVVMSHPHDDHGNLLADVLHCYRVATVYDSGRINDTVFYREFLEAVAAEPEVVYRTAASPTGAHSLTVGGASIQLPKGNNWTRFEEGESVELGADAKFTILHADAESHEDPNGNSIVMRLDLGGTSLLLMGDAESGPRADPSAALGDIEEKLVANHAPLLDADILQVGHHGSMTSSRKAFLQAVSPKLALISGGPHKYGSVTLPDAVVVNTLKTMKIDVLSTNKSDTEGCDTDDRIGWDNAKPGGCDNVIVEIGPGP